MSWPTNPANYGGGRRMNEGPRGEGRVTALQNPVVIVARRDMDAIMHHKNAHEDEGVLAPPFGSDAVWAMVAGEWAFTLERQDDSMYPKALSAVNGVRADVDYTVATYEEIRRASRTRLRVIGMLTDGLSFPSLDPQELKQPLVGIQVSGTTTTRAGEDLPFGALIEAVPPNREEIALQSTHRVGVPPNKAALLSKRFTVGSAVPKTSSPDYKAAVRTLAQSSAAARKFDEETPGMPLTPLKPLWGDDRSRRNEDNILNNIHQFMIEKLEHFAQLRTRMLFDADGGTFRPEEYQSVTREILPAEFGVSEESRGMTWKERTELALRKAESPSDYWNSEVLQKLAYARPVRRHLEMSPEEEKFEQIYSHAIVTNLIDTIYRAITTHYVAAGSNVVGTVIEPGKKGESVRLSLH